MIHSYCGFKQKQKDERKINKKYIILYLLLQITITKIDRLNTTIIYTKMTNNDEKRDSLTGVFL